MIELYVPVKIERVEKLSSLEFLRDYVSKNIPVIFTGVATEWKAIKDWDLSYLLDKIGGTDVTVSQTPNGRADAVLHFPTDDPPYPILDDTKENLHGSSSLFVMPHDEIMKFSKFVHLSQSSKDTEDATVHYIQYQNSNFTAQFHRLHEDIDMTSLKFAEEAFGCEPEATNFWMGDNRSVSSLHKDHYENLYTVIRGTKKFTLFPPTDRPFLRHRKLRSSIFRPVSGSDGSNFGLSNISEDCSVPWIVVDPDNPDLLAFPEYEKAKPIYCEIHEGETLYLPSLYYHQVSQQVDTEGKVIAVNSWFDMQYDIKYNYFTLLHNLSECKNSSSN
mmetsp:Transcript_12411/g.15448  ORF Transcript_12411/g.15448 Transcript_12411/m.15448 type:complete len:331 (-) Transcript_12411:48-1040(-)|eukprot:CAMPEP_0206186992 /NCGR_PEP_ID=MMETSP0166-20121206/2731_1 /ASSEMBLY_ACC=CAM_ASM_000260 /TAXON_ID=95228 /ORGANISM="Vannella robusta, Strain DIVA3 518/3/11/1/6" /LENGTH=330 /DNA_ID=CAMNT_0053602479 /DNA_START=150 /DNA_END=1142 /DNA_ORIENTATION=+